MIQIFWLIAEKIYKFGFWCALLYRRALSRPNFFSFTIISVGNISVGGTGKSVFVQFLARMIGQESCAIVLRGYKGSQSHQRHAYIVGADGQAVMSAYESGDEALMHVNALLSLVVICPDRMRALWLIQKRDMDNKITAVILDDAYQNFAVKKNKEILLLDARAPFDNGYCLPRGRLREKDITRADCLVLTHADDISTTDRNELKAQLNAIHPAPIFFGRHKHAGIFLNNKIRMPLGQRYFVVAAIGSPEGFLQDLIKNGVTVVGARFFSNHHMFTKADCDLVDAAAIEAGGATVLCTEKDWVKINRSSWAVAHVEFEFLSLAEYDDFARLIRA